MTHTTETTPNAEKIAAGLTEAQRAYLEAVAASPEPYLPRHGVTANWALRHGYADTVVRLGDGREGLWREFASVDRLGVGIASIGGQRLTPLGLAVREILRREA